MIACLMLASPAGGNLVFIYSTGLDRAAEVMRAAKAIVDWVRSTDAMERLGFPSKARLEADNSREFSLVSGYGNVNKCRSRPRGTEQCRGDAPKTVWVDEIAFVENNWYLRFLMPLQAVSARRFIYATTPPLAGTWFCDTVDLIRKANQQNDWHFEYTQHTLACDECNAAGVGHECIHKLHNVPYWKSLVKMHSLAKLVPASERTAFNTEVLGMEERNERGYVDERLLEALKEKPRMSIGRVDRVFVAIDPASHRRSSMGLACVCLGGNGEHIILGVAAIPCSRPQLVEVQLIVKEFLRKMRSVPELATSILTPVVECNGSEIYSNSLVEVFGGFPPVVNSFTEKQLNVSKDIGVFTSHSSKIWALTNLTAALLKNSIRISPSLFTVCENVFNSRVLPTTPEEALETAFRQLSRFRDQKDGSVSGKGSGEEDVSFSSFPSSFSSLIPAPGSSFSWISRDFSTHSTLTHTFHCGLQLPPTQQDSGMALLLGTQWNIYVLNDEHEKRRTGKSRV